MLNETQKEILIHLQRIWSMYPSVRFGQLLQNVGFSGFDYYYTHDKDSLKMFEKYEASVAYKKGE